MSYYLGHYKYLMDFQFCRSFKTKVKPFFECGLILVGRFCFHLVSRRLSKPDVLKQFEGASGSSRESRPFSTKSSVDVL